MSKWGHYSPTSWKVLVSLDSQSRRGMADRSPDAVCEYPRFSSHHNRGVRRRRFPPGSPVGFWGAPCHAAGNQQRNERRARFGHLDFSCRKILLAAARRQSDRGGAHAIAMAGLPRTPIAIAQIGHPHCGKPMSLVQ